MYTDLGSFTLRSGAQVQAGIVRGPDGEWAGRIAPMLRHKGEPWNWQIESLLTHELHLEARFYILHRDGAPFANVMTVERQGVGIFGHVWTDEADRRQGASTRLIELQMADFAARRGRALYLGTGYDSPAYHIYTGFGFRSVEPGSGYMAYFAEDAAAFDDTFFAPGPMAVEPLSWRHWPLLQPLCLGDGPELVRSAGMHILGRGIAEGEPMPLLQENEARAAAGAPPAAVVLVNTATGSVFGLASACEHPVWFDKTLVDLFCRPEAWSYAAAMLDALALPADADLVAYCNDGAPAQEASWERLGLRGMGVLNRWMTGPAGDVDVRVLVRAGF